MLIAPHPDDESLACGVILQEAIRRGAQVRVVYVTDGDNNPWPQRVLQRKWRLSAADRKGWGRLRRAEALAALRALGLSDSDAQFLGLPDQGLTSLLLRPNNTVLARLAGQIACWNPTDILAPSPSDIHPDHNAVAIMLRLVLTGHAPKTDAIKHWSYLVHGQSAAFAQSAIAVAQSSREIARKRSAILCHRTQVKLSRRRFLRYTARPERLARPERNQKTMGEGPIQSIYRHDSTLRLALSLKFKPFPGQESAILVLGRNPEGEVRSFRIRIPVRSETVEILDCSTQELVAVAHYQGNAFAGEMVFPTNMFSPSDSLFLKLHCGSWFFDQAGWLEVPTVLPEPVSVPYRKVESALPAIR